MYFPFLSGLLLKNLVTNRCKFAIRVVHLFSSCLVFPRYDGFVIMRSSVEPYLAISM